MTPEERRRPEMLNGSRRARIARGAVLSVKNEEFVRAVTLGLFDYLRKSKACGFVVSLSGGADSSAVACLVAYMVSLARSCAPDCRSWMKRARAGRPRR